MQKTFGTKKYSLNIERLTVELELDFEALLKKRL